MVKRKKCLFYEPRKCIAPKRSEAKCIACFGTHMIFILNNFLKTIENAELPVNRCFNVYLMVKDFRETQTVFVNWLHKYHPEEAAEAKKRAEEFQEKIEQKIGAYRA